MKGRFGNVTLHPIRESNVRQKDNRYVRVMKSNSNIRFRQHTVIVYDNVKEKRQQTLPLRQLRITHYAL